MLRFLFIPLVENGNGAGGDEPRAFLHLVVNFKFIGHAVSDDTY